MSDRRGVIPLIYQHVSPYGLTWISRRGFRCVSQCWQPNAYTFSLTADDMNLGSRPNYITEDKSMLLRSMLSQSLLQATRACYQ